MPEPFLTVHLPWPRYTSTNHLYRPTERNGFRVLTGWAQAYRETVMVLVKQERPIVPGGDVELCVWLLPKDKRGYDADNTLKLMVDSICKALGIDDSTIVHLDVRKCRPVPKGEQPYLLVTMASAEGEKGNDV